MLVGFGMVVITLAVLYALLDQSSVFAVENELAFMVFQNETAAQDIHHHFVLLHVAFVDPVSSVYCDHFKHCLSEFGDRSNDDWLGRGALSSRHAVVNRLDSDAILLQFFRQLSFDFVNTNPYISSAHCLLLLKVPIKVYRDNPELQKFDDF